MINDKKIDEAVNEICDYGSIYDSEYRINGFKKGAKWAINEFLKNLWHPASEQPNIEGKPILFNCIDHDCVPSWCVYPIGFNGNWKVFCISHGITKWLYIDDLLLLDNNQNHA